jgi:cyanate lyase
MAQASLDITSRSAERLDALGVSSNCLADICHLPRTVVAAHLKGTKPLGNYEAQRLLDVIELMHKLVEKLRPIPVSFHYGNADRIRETLIALEHGELEISVKDKRSPFEAGTRALATKF